MEKKNLQLYPTYFTQWHTLVPLHQLFQHQEHVLLANSYLTFKSQLRVISSGKLSMIYPIKLVTPSSKPLLLKF